MARSCLDRTATLAAEAVEALLARSEGIPLLVEELLFTAIDAGWETDRRRGPGLGADVGRAPTRGLPAPGRRLLVAAALLGRSLRLEARGAGRADLDDDAAAAAVPPRRPGASSSTSKGIELPVPSWR